MITLLLNWLVYKLYSKCIRVILRMKMSGDAIYFDEKLTDNLPNWTEDLISGLAFNSLLLPTIFMIFLAFRMSRKCQNILRRNTTGYRIPNHHGVRTAQFNV